MESSRPSDNGYGDVLGKMYIILRGHSSPLANHPLLGEYMSLAKLSIFRLKALLNAVSLSVSRGYDSRPELEYIKLDFTKDSVQASACSGYLVARYTFKQNNEEEFTAFIKPFKFKLPKKYESRLVTIVVSDDITSLTLPTNWGEIVYRFNNPIWKLDVNNLLVKPEGVSNEICLGSRYLSDIAKQSAYLSSHGVILSITEPMKPAFFESGNSSEKFEAMLLPIRSIQ